MYNFNDRFKHKLPFATPDNNLLKLKSVVCAKHFITLKIPYYLILFYKFFYIYLCKYFFRKSFSE